MINSTVLTGGNATTGMTWQVVSQVEPSPSMGGDSSLPPHLLLGNISVSISGSATIGVISNPLMVVQGGQGTEGGGVLGDTGVVSPLVGAMGGDGSPWVVGIPWPSPLGLSTVGGGNCTAGAHPSSPDSCVAGCCVESACRCRPGYTGPRCEVELACALMPHGSASFSVLDESCFTNADAAGRSITCTCRMVGTVALFRFRNTPAMNLIGFHPDLLSRLSLQHSSSMVPMLFALCYALILAIAVTFDARTVYVATTDPALPDWLRPRPFTFLGDLLATARTRTALLRLFFVHPGHTVYTRAQLVHVLMASLTASLLSIALFLGREEETCSARAQLLAFIALCFSSVVATLGRLAFKLADLKKGSFRRKLYYANKKSRLDAKGGAASLGAGKGDMLGVTLNGAQSVKSDDAVHSRVVSLELGGPPPTSKPASKLIGALERSESPGAGDGGARRIMMSRLKGRDSAQRRERHGDPPALKLPSVAFLSVGDDGVSVGLRIRAQPDAPPTFLPASHVAGRVIRSTIWVVYDPSRLPNGASPLTAEMVLLGATKGLKGSQAPFQARDRAVVLAWAFNLALLLSMWLLLALVLRTRELLREQLLASPVDDATWATTLISSTIISVAVSLVVVDAIKACCLALTSKPALARCGLRKDGGRLAKCVFLISKPLRRAHKVLDVLT